MGDNNTGIKKKSEMIRKSTATLKQLDEENKCECSHRSKEGTYTLIANRNGDKHYTHMCTQCHKPIHINVYAEERFQEATLIIDDMCDIIKMMSKPLSEADEKLFKRVAKTQMAVRKTIPEAYKACLANNNNKNRNRNNSNSNAVMTAPNRS